MLFPYSDSDFLRIKDTIKREAGIHLEARKKEMVYARLSGRLRSLGLSGFADYCDLLDNSAAKGTEMPFFISALTTNVTGFFRENHHFETLHAYLDGIASAGNGADPVYLWSASCASGEEAYSIAMTADDALKSRRPLKILATDIDGAALNRAVAGVYNDESASTIPLRYHAYINEDDNGSVCVSDKIRAHICFKQLNLTGEWPMRKQYHAVFCRNTLIYFEERMRHHITAGLGALLRPGGMLFLGHSENSYGAALEGFTRCGHTVFRKTAEIC